MNSWNPPSLLIVDDDVGFVHAVAHIAKLKGFDITVAADPGHALDRILQCDYDLLLVDLDLANGTGLALLEAVDRQRIQLIMTSERAVTASARASRRDGGVDPLLKPIAPEYLGQLLDHCLRHRRRRAALPGRSHDMVGASPAFAQLVHLIDKVAPTAAAVLVHGESGSGKELVARAIHHASGRGGPFVAVNCGAVAGDLLASQLFGHEKGSFTGAVTRHRGFLEEAARGTLLLDEITEMPAGLQAHLLRVLDYGSYRRVGGDTELPVEVRIVSATNRDPLAAVAAGQLREDLYYRLCGFAIPVPPLREREDDVVLLADAFLAELNAAHDTRHAFAIDVPETLRALPWTGNVRELRNAVVRAYILAEDGLVQAPQPSTPASGAVAESDSTITFAIGTSLEEMERQILRKTLQHYGNNRRRAAAALGITPRTIRNRLARDRARLAGSERVH
jgi:DNA-binding NtrC family response regulator